MPPPRTLVAIATYNEIETLPTLVDAVLAALPRADVLVVDDNSPDGTGRWAEQRAASDPRVKVIHRAGKLGLGTATFAAMRRAIDQGYDVVCTLDADWSHPPDKLPELVEALGFGPQTEAIEGEASNAVPPASSLRPKASHASASVAIGSRYVPGGRIEGWPRRRRVASRLVNTAARWLLRLGVRDASGAFRAYRVDSLRGLDFDQMRGTGYAYLEEILWRLKRRGATFTESPITFSERRAGASKINTREAAAAVALLLRLGAEEWFRMGRS